MKLKYCLEVLFFVIFSTFICSCSRHSEIAAETYVLAGFAGGECFYESEAFDSVSNGEKHIITYYSAAANKCVPICTKPNCKHNTDDCTAVVGNAVGFLKTEDGLIFFDYNDDGGLDLIKSEFNGSNRKIIASLENMTSYTLIDIAYCNGKALCLYKDMVGFEDEMNGAEIDLQMTDEYINRIYCIDIDSGKVENILYKKDHAASLLGALIYDNKLIYSYESYIKDIRNLSEEDNLSEYYRAGFYCLDLETGKEKRLSDGFDKMIMAEQSFNYFDSEKIICMDYADNRLYLYNLNTGEFMYISECAGVYNNFIADCRDIIFLKSKEDTQYTDYNLETREFTDVLKLPENCLPSCIVGNTVWLRFTDVEGRLSWGWIGREDFINGKHDNIKFAYYVNSLDGSVQY
ncbi:MAG: hypothetical protein NC452_16470 [Eubacterium sp.]|nr:hypothetical protein [Eubacterium sp.]